MSWRALLADRRNACWVAALASGFGGFSYSHSQLDVVINYIRNQEEHHKTKSFREEYIEFMKRYAIDYKTEYLLEDA